MIDFFVPGVPVTQGSKRLIAGRMIESGGQRLQDWRTAVAFEAHRARNSDGPSSGPVAVHLLFFFSRPKTHYGTGRNADTLRKGMPRAPSTRPDIDKLARAVLDALTGICYRDDGQVASLRVEKRWSDPDPPGLQVLVWTID